MFVLAVRTQAAAFGLVRMVWNRSDAAEISRLHFTSKTRGSESEERRQGTSNRETMTLRTRMDATRKR